MKAPNCLLLHFLPILFPGFSLVWSSIWPGKFTNNFLACLDIPIDFESSWNIFPLVTIWALIQLVRCIVVDGYEKFTTLSSQLFSLLNNHFISYHKEFIAFIRKIISHQLSLKLYKTGFWTKACILKTFNSKRIYWSKALLSYLNHT